MKTWQKILLRIVILTIFLLNFILRFFNRALFKKNNSQKPPQNILIYKIGNIGDIVCAVPSFIAIRRNFPQAKITLLTSPGRRGAPGAKELLKGAWYLNEMKAYYSDEIDSFRKKKKFIRDLRKNQYDLFIQLPDDLAKFRTILRNMIFAKFIGARSAFGFKVRSVQLFKKTQVDYTMAKTEVESLLDLLRENGLETKNVEYDFYIREAQKNKVENLLKEKWGEINKKEGLIAISAGGKREGNKWPIENFAALASYLENKYNAKIIVLGGSGDIPNAEIIKKSLANEKNILIAAGKLDLLETLELLKYCSFLISNSTGIIHLAAAAGIPAIGFYTIRDVFGRWFPYGNQHKILYHKFFNCDYRDEICIEGSVKKITINEAIQACDSYFASNSISGAAF